MNSALRMSMFSICSLVALAGCKARTSNSESKEIGAFVANKGAWKGGGRNSFYGAPRGQCTFSNFLAKNDIAGYQALENKDWEAYAPKLSASCIAARGHLDSDGTVCLIPQSPVGSNTSFQGYIKLVENLSQLASVLDIDVAGKLSASGMANTVISDFSLSPTARFFAERQDNDRSLYVIVNVRFDAGNENFLNPAVKPHMLKPIADAIIKSEAATTPDEKAAAKEEIDFEMADFLDTCGDEFSNTINYGGEFTGIMQVTVKSSASKEQTLASLQASIGFGPKLFGATAGLEASKEELRGALQSVQNVSIWFSQSGGNPDGVRLVGLLDGIHGYQKLIESAENYIRLFNNPAAVAVGSNTHFDGTPITTVDPRPLGSRDRTVKPDIVVGEGNKGNPPADPNATPPVDPGTTGTTGTPGATGMQLTGPEPTSNAQFGLDEVPGAELPRINAGIRDANFLNYAIIDDVKRLLRRAKIAQTNPPDGPRNYHEELLARRDRLLNYLAKFERIKTNYQKLENWASETVQPKTKNQDEYIEKYRTVYNAWNSTMKMDPNKNCKNLGTRCLVPEETEELKKIMRDSPTINLMEFKKPVSIITGKGEPTGSTKAPLVPLKKDVNWVFDTQEAPTILPGYSRFTENTYQMGVNFCGDSMRFPRPSEFKELLASHFLTFEGIEYLKYSQVVKITEQDRPDYQRLCFWEQATNNLGKPITVDDKAPYLPAWTNETLANGGNDFNAPADRTCFVVCILKEARPD